MEQRALIIEDDPEIRQLLEIHLRDFGFVVDSRENGPQGLAAALAGEYHFIITDVMLPGLDGFEVCKRIRAEKPAVPILMLTARADVVDRVLGLELGADDYLVKPFSIRELIARIKAVIRRSSKVSAPDTHSAGEETNEKLVFGPLVIHMLKRKVSLNGRQVELTQIEFELLAFLAANPGRPFTRAQLLNRVWGYDYSGYEHTVNTTINRLRGKVEPDPSHPQFILTERGFGYRFVDPGPPFLDEE